MGSLLKLLSDFPHFNGQPPDLVTGGCGFVGRHIVARLAGLGRSVVVVDNLSTGLPLSTWLPGELRDRVVLASMDVREFFRTHGELIQRRGTDASSLSAFGDVFHLAAVVGGRAKIDGDPLAVAQDLAIDADFFHWAVQHRPRRILYASSSAAYPVHLQDFSSAVALKEEFISFDAGLGQPDMTYGWSKLTGEYLARIAAEHYGLHVVSVRPFSGYGEDQDVSYPVPAIADRVARREDPLSVWGSGEQGRDFIHIEDCVDAMLLALDRVEPGGVVNIGSGQLTTFRELAEMLADIAGYRPKIQPQLDKPTGVARRVADVSRMRRLLRWTPRISLREGLTRVLRATEQRIAGTLSTRENLRLGKGSLEGRQHAAGTPHAGGVHGS